MEVIDRYRRAASAYGQHVHQIGAHQWHQPTPCSEWEVRALVNHLVGENLWAVELFAGHTVTSVGSKFDGDLLGDDPVRVWDRSAAAALAAIETPGAMESKVHLSFGDFSGAEYTDQLFADMLVHGWDLARAIGAEERLDADLVDACATWFAGWEDGYRSAGVIGSAQEGADSDPATALLGAFGRNASADDTLSVIRRFNEAFHRHDVPAVMALMTDDCVFEDTTPPHGRRHEGQTAVRSAWEELFESTPSASLNVEEGVIAGERGTYRWLYQFEGGSVRGVDVYRVSSGKVAEKLSYVKG